VSQYPFVCSALFSAGETKLWFSLEPVFPPNCFFLWFGFRTPFCHFFSCGVVALGQVSFALFTVIFFFFSNAPPPLLLSFSHATFSLRRAGRRQLVRFLLDMVGRHYEAAALPPPIPFTPISSQASPFFGPYRAIFFCMLYVAGVDIEWMKRSGHECFVSTSSATSVLHLLDTATGCPSATVQLRFQAASVIRGRFYFSQRAGELCPPRT